MATLSYLAEREQLIAAATRLAEFAKTWKF